MDEKRIERGRGEQRRRKSEKLSSCSERRGSPPEKGQRLLTFGREGRRALEGVRRGNF